MLNLIKTKFAFTGMLLPLLLVACVVSVRAQQRQQTAPVSGAPSPATATANTPASTTGKATITANSTPAELARAAFEAQGGENFRQMKSLVLMGSADVFSQSLPAPLAAKFAVITAGERYRLELQMPTINVRQIYDGKQSYSSVPGVSLPPPDKFGLYVINKFDQPGYTVTALPDQKKQRAFRITDAEGNATDFYIDPATGRIMNFSFTFSGVNLGFEHKNLKMVDGVLVPYNFTQKLEVARGTFYVEYKVKDAKVNQPLSDDVFAIPAQ